MAGITNQAIAQLISDGLRNGLVHPGDPAKNVPAKPIGLPVFKTTGLPKEHADLVDATVKMLGEAIVALIEQDHAIVERDHLEELQAVAAEAPDARMIPVHCRCDKRHTDPLMLLKVDGRPRITLDGKQLIGQLSKRAAECPHGRKQ